MIILLAVDNGFEKALSSQVMRLKFPDNTEFTTMGDWVEVVPCPDRSDPLGNKRYRFQSQYVIAILADDQPLRDAEISLDLPSLQQARKGAGY